VRCTRWIARSSAPSDIVQDGRIDETLMVGGLTERRSYLVEPAIFALDKSERVRLEVERRKKQLEAVKAFTSREQLGAFARQSGVRWYILHAGDTVLWPADVLEEPAFTDRGFRVYDLEQTWKPARPDPTRIEAKARRPQTPRPAVRPGRLILTLLTANDTSRRSITSL
jgi:hypothetical protein